MIRKPGVMWKRFIALSCAFSMVAGSLFSDGGTVTARAAGGSEGGVYYENYSPEPVRDTGSQNELENMFWDFMSVEAGFIAANGVCIQNEKGEFRGLQIDATSGKFDCSGETRTKYAQFNNGTIVKVPVSGLCKVTVTGFDTNYSVDDVPATAKVTTVVSDGKKEYVTIKATANTYLESIRRTKISGPEEEADEGTYDLKTRTSLEIKGFVTENIAGAVEAGQNGYDHGWIAQAADALVVIKLKKKANITVECCQWNAGTGWELTASSGIVSSELYTESAENGAKRFLVQGAEAGFVALGFPVKNEYIHSIKIEYRDESAATYDVTVTNDGDDAYGTASADVAKAAEGDVVTLTATPATGYVFDEWEVLQGNVSIANDRFTMPAEAVRIKAHFRAETLEETCIKAGDYNFKKWTEINTRGMTVENITATTSGHGIYTDQNATTAKMTLKLLEKANLTVITCGFCAGINGTMEVSTGQTPEKKEIDVGEAKDGKLNQGLQFVVMNVPAGEVVLTFCGNMYIHQLNVEYVKEVGPRNIDVWDFGGKAEKDTEKYTNNITPEGLIASKGIGTEGKFVGGDYKNLAFGDLTMVVEGGDRFYSDLASLASYNAGTYGYAQTKFDDIYTSAGAWYCNGTGGSGRRYISIANVQAGDKILLYGGISQNGPSQIFFEGQGAASGQKDSVDVTAGNFVIADFVAQKTGTYKIWENNTGKPMYHRVMRVPAVKVSGTINFNGYSGRGHTVKFINKKTKRETIAQFDSGSYSVSLAPGYEYTAMFSGASGYGFTKACKYITTKDEDGLNGSSKTVNLEVEQKQVYTYSGKIVGFAEGYDRVKDLGITMVPGEDYSEDEMKVTVNADMTFTVPLMPEVPYTIVLSGVNDYEVKSQMVINKEENYSADIEVGLKAMQPVTGKFLNLENAEVTALSFTNVADNYVYAASIADGGYSISLRDGSYLAKATVNGYSTRTHAVVKGKALERDLFFVSTTAKPALARVSDIYVGYADQANNYATVSEAMEACERMNPASEEERITVHIAPGTYREQIQVNAPYVSLVNDSNKEVLLTWYYGIGYTYYSADAKGFYNPESAYDKFDKKIAAKWGTAVYVTDKAEAFRAQGITFENSFNRYITEEELEDGVTCDSLQVARNYSTDVLSKAATERAAAMVIEAQMTEFRDCKFYSSQDTLYTGGKAYFKNCLIEGQTDYIYGSGNVVFDTCNLSFKGYSANSMGGYITAQRPADDNELGYLFRNCAVTASDNAKVTVTPGYFGRPWGADAKVTLLNTKLQKASLITAEGWNDMSGAQPENANYYEFNTTTMSGEAVDTASRKGHVMTEAEAANIQVEAYFGDWTPAFYKAEGATLAFKTAPFISDNGDLNTPYPGHTLTVGYSLGEENDANDMSRIQWYRVKGTEETLLKTATAGSDKTYKITKADIGSHIKVVVTPETVSGKTAEAASAVTEFEVRDGYEDPDAENGGSALGDGINIFLAGDSTVCPYPGRNEGSWGESLPNYFDGDKVTIVNRANGGRSARSFINEGKLDDIAGKIGEGDYFFIQFGHNDCADDAKYLEERFEPLGEPNAEGIYPVTPGVKKPTPDTLSSLGYGAECYTYDCGGTYKWYLKQYIDVAKKAGATPILVTPVSRLNYNSDGTIKPHHDASSNKNKSNTYVEAVKQLGREENVLVIDGFGLTKALMENAYAAAGKDTYGKQIMFAGDSTHCNKLGGMIEAAAIVNALMDVRVDGKPLSVAYGVKKPAKATALTTDEKTIFTVDANGKLTAYDLLNGYETEAAYWTTTGQKIMDEIGQKVADLNAAGGSGTGGDVSGGDVSGGDVSGGDVSGGDITEPPVAKECKVSFHMQGHGTAPAPLTVKAGEKLAAPAKQPEEPGYLFGGWYKDAACTVAWDFEKDIVTDDTVLYAKWTEDKNTVTPVDIDDTYYAQDTRIDLSTLSCKIGDIKAKVYDGKPYLPTVKVTATVDGRNVTLTEGADYRVIYKNNINAGTAQAIVKGYGQYKGELEPKEFQISPKSIGKLKVVAGGLGKNAPTDKIPVYIYDNGYRLVQGKDYTIDPLPANATESKGKPEVTIKATEGGNYDGEKKVKITVYDTDKVIQEEDVAVVTPSMDFTGKALRCGVKVVCGDQTLTEKTDYTVKYTNNKEAGTAYVTVTGKKAYAGCVVKSFEIKPVTIEDGFKLKAAPKKATYNGKAQKPKVTVLGADGKTLKANKDYILLYSNNFHAGTATVTIKGLGNYAETKDTPVSFTIDPQKINKAAVKGTKDNLTLTYAKRKLIPGTDYEAQPGEESKGKIALTITGKGDFTGEVTKKVKIQ